MCTRTHFQNSPQIAVAEFPTDATTTRLEFDAGVSRELSVNKSRKLFLLKRSEAGCQTRQKCCRKNKKKQSNQQKVKENKLTKPANFCGIRDN